MSLSGIAICATALWSTICDVSGHICRINAGQTWSTFRLSYSSSSLCISSVCFVQYTQKCSLQRYLEEMFTQKLKICLFKKPVIAWDAKGDLGPLRTEDVIEHFIFAFSKWKRLSAKHLVLFHRRKKFIQVWTTWGWAGHFWATPGLFDMFWFRLGLKVYYFSQAQVLLFFYLNIGIYLYNEPIKGIGLLKIW